eukprot:6054456-Prymnesium_polylepis.1
MQRRGSCTLSLISVQLYTTHVSTRSPGRTRTSLTKAYVLSHTCTQPNSPSAAASHRHSSLKSSAQYQPCAMHTRALRLFSNRRTQSHTDSTPMLEPKHRGFAPQSIAASSRAR